MYFSGLINLLDLFTEPRETCLLFYYKECYRWRDAQGKTWRKGAELPRPLQQPSTSRNCHTFSYAEALQTLFFFVGRVVVVMETSLHEHDRSMEIMSKRDWTKKVWSDVSRLSEVTQQGLSVQILQHCFLMCKGKDHFCNGGLTL